MSFGKRVSGVVTTARASPVRATTGLRPYAAYPLALAAAGAGFLASAVVSSAWAVFHSPTSPYTFVGLTILVIVKAGPTAMVLATIGLLLGDLIRRKLGVRSLMLSAFLCGLTTLMLLLTIAMITAKLKSLGFQAALLLPGVLAGGALLGRFRKP